MLYFSKKVRMLLKKKKKKEYLCVNAKHLLFHVKYYLFSQSRSSLISWISFCYVCVWLSKGNKLKKEIVNRKAKQLLCIYQLKGKKSNKRIQNQQILETSNYT